MRLESTNAIEVIKTISDLEIELEQEEKNMTKLNE